MSLTLLSSYFKQHQYAVMVGGSGLYIDAVCKGIDFFPDVDEELRNILKSEFQKKGITFFQKQLKELDPAYYDVVDLNNPNRILRALEVCIMTRKPYSDQRKKNLLQETLTLLK